MADDSVAAIGKALEAGRSPPERQAPRPIERPIWFRWDSEGREIIGRAFEVDKRYTINETRDGFRFTYWEVLCVGSTAGPLCDSDAVDPATGFRPIVTWVPV